jgi:hypothetical protein
MKDAWPQTIFVMAIFMVKDFRWEAVVRFVDICTIVDNIIV